MHRTTRSAPRTDSASPSSRPQRERQGRHRVAAAGEPRGGRRACAPRGTCSPTRSSASATTRSSTRLPTATCELVDDGDAGRRARHRASSSPAGASCWPRRRPKQRATATARRDGNGPAQPHRATASGADHRAARGHARSPNPACAAWRCSSTSRSSSSSTSASVLCSPALHPERLHGHRRPDRPGERPPRQALEPRRRARSRRTTPSRRATRRRLSATSTTRAEGLRLRRRRPSRSRRQNTAGTTQQLQKQATISPTRSVPPGTSRRASRSSSSCCTSCRSPSATG